MAGIWTRASVLLRDNAGNIARVAVCVAAAAIDPGGGAIAALQTAMVACTKAFSPRAESGASRGETKAASGTGSFAAVEDRATLTFSGADGSTMTVEMPAPKDACFIAGTAIVDASETHIKAVIDAYIALGVTKYNQDLTFVKGIRTRKKQMKR